MSKKEPQTKGMKPDDVVMLAETKYNFIQGHVDEAGEKFDFIDLYLGANGIMINMSREDFVGVVELFKEVVSNEK